MIGVLVWGGSGVVRSSRCARAMRCPPTVAPSCDRNAGPVSVSRLQREMWLFGPKSPELACGRRSQDLCYAEEGISQTGRSNVMFRFGSNRAPNPAAEGLLP